jgi:hypothetical protein
MSKKDLKVLGMIATVGVVAVVVHGITSKKWETAHTLFSVLGAVVALSTLT